MAQRERQSLIQLREVLRQRLKEIDERLRESKAALDKATAHVQSVFEQIKNRKP
jgi:hypothetical protein